MKTRDGRKKARKSSRSEETVEVDTIDLVDATAADVSAASAPVGQLQRGLALLEAVVTAVEPQSVTSLSARVGLDDSTVHRLIQALVRAGYVVRVGNSRRYLAGPKALAPLSTYHPLSVFVRDTRDVLIRLRDETSESIALVIYLSTERLIAETIRGDEALSPMYETWLRTPIHASASGLAQLMLMPPSRVRETLGPGPYEPTTKATITDPAELAERLLTLRLKGYAVSRDEFFVGLSAVAAPIVFGGRPLGALAIAGTTSRLSEALLERLGAKLLEASRLITRAVPSINALANFVGLSSTH